MVLKSNVEEKEYFQENVFFTQLDKGIDDMETGKLTPHQESMKKIRESVSAYAI